MDNKEDNTQTTPAMGNAEFDFTENFKSIQSIIKCMEDKFTMMSTEITQRIDEMGSRITELEQSITDLIQQNDMMENYEITSTSEQNDAVGQSKDTKDGVDG